MSKKYSLYVNNDNLYGCSGTYKVMDGKGTVITDTTALTLDASGKTKIGEQTVADTEVAYWGGTKFTFTSVGAPTSVSGEIARNDYHYYDLSATPITYYRGNNFSMSFSLAITAISGQTITYPKVFSIATNENFTNAESVSFASAGTQSLHYTESNFGGDKGTGYLYIKDTENNAVYMFINTLKIFNKPTLTQTSISASGTTYSVVFTATNPNDIACNLWTANYTEAFTDQGTISANGTLSFTITSSSTTGIAHAYLKLDNVRSTENAKSWEYTPSTIHVNGASSVSVGGTANIYITDSAGDAISGLTVSTGSSTTFSISLVSGAQYQLTGISAGTGTLYLGATGYTSKSVTITTTPPTSYTLTLHYYKDGTEDVSLRETKSIAKGTEVSPVDYKIELPGYTYQDSVPNDSFTMNDNNSIQFNYINSSPKGSVDNPLTENDLKNNYIYWEYNNRSFCVKNVTSSDVIYNLIDGSFSENSIVYVKAGFDFTLKFQTMLTSDSSNIVYAISPEIATTSPIISSDTNLNPGRTYSYTIHGLSKGEAFHFESVDDDGVYFGNISINIV